MWIAKDDDGAIRLHGTEPWPIAGRMDKMKFFMSADGFGIKIKTKFKMKSNPQEVQITIKEA